jgi:multidrug resistance efflux pump
MNQESSEIHLSQQFHTEHGVIWEQFVESSTVEEFYISWLALLCSMINGVKSGLLLLGAPDKGPYSPMAVWPDMRQDVNYLVPVAEQSLKDRRGLLNRDKQSELSNIANCYVAYPLEIDGKLNGVVVLDVFDRSDSELQDVLRQIHWGASWLEVMRRRQKAEQDAMTISRIATAMEVAATALRPDKFQGVAMAVVNDIATRLGCDRVSIGRLKKKFIHLVAISHTARFDKKTSLIQSIESAMEEAIDQQCAIAYPPPEGSNIATRLHEEIIQRYDAASICTIPLPGREHIFGAITLERNSGVLFDPATIELCQAIAHLVGPMHEIIMKEDRWFGSKMMDSAQKQFEKIAGPGHFVLKALLSFIALALIIVSVVKTEHRVSAKTVIEGSVQRVIAAPFDGYISSTVARAGDVVGKGQTLCMLDDRDLVLERSRWASEGEQHRRRYQGAVANHDRAEARIAAAQKEQAEAQVNLIDEKLSRAKIEAPFDGVVVSGDLTQKLGSPVRQGDELFKLAPLEGYRVIIQVDEREIIYIKEGQKGQLILSALSDKKLPFIVKKVTPVSVAEEGKNYFRVEAEIEQGSKQFLPGMEGIGKIESGKRTIIWIWTHGIIDWFRLWIWSWWL